MWNHSKMALVVACMTGHVVGIAILAAAETGMAHSHVDMVQHNVQAVHLEGAAGDAEEGREASRRLSSDGIDFPETSYKISSTQGGFVGILENGDGFGCSIAILGDLDGDGVSDLAVGAMLDDDGSTEPDDDEGRASENLGAVWILFQRANGTVKGHQKISSTDGDFRGVLDNDYLFGAALACLGDLDGDGVQDLAVGAPGDRGGGSGRGAVWILFLHSNGTVRGQSRISDTEEGFTGTLADGNDFGLSMTVAESLDYRGAVDLFVGAPYDNDGGFERGAAWYLSLHSNGTVESYQKISDTQGGFTGTLSNNVRFGTAVAYLGRLSNNTSGLRSIAVGSSSDSTGGNNRGAVWILFLNSDATVDEFVKILPGGAGFTGVLADGDAFGISLSCMGDLDGDGVMDLAVGASGDAGRGTSRGAVWILLLNSDGTNKEHHKVADAEGGFDGSLTDRNYFGSAVASTCESGPGARTLYVGATGDQDGGSGRGAMWTLSQIEPSPTPSTSPSSSPSNSPTPSVSSSPSNSPTPSVSSSPSNSPTPSVSSSPSNSPTPSVSSSPSNSPTPSVSSSPSNSPTPSVSSSPSNSPTPSRNPPASSPGTEGEPATGISCMDSVMNGEESDIDCGDPSDDYCPLCSLGRTCLTSSNCMVGLLCADAERRCTAPVKRRGRRLLFSNARITRVTPPNFQEHLLQPFQTGVQEAASADEVTINRLDSATGTRRQLQATSSAVSGSEVDFTVRIAMDRDEQQARQAVLAYLNGTAGGGRTSLIADLRAAVPSELQDLQVSIDAIEMEVEVLTQDLQVEEAPPLDGGEQDDSDDGLSAGAIAIIAVGVAMVLAVAVGYVCCCKCATRREADKLDTVGSYKSVDNMQAVSKPGAGSAAPGEIV